MTNIQKGKFCSICTKNVFDFTIWTDEEIIFFLNHSDESVCARLNESQLNRILSLNQKSQIKHWHKIVASILILASSSNIYATENKTKQIIPQYPTSKQEDNIEKLSINNPIDSIKNIIRGQLIERSSKEPIKNVFIEIDGTEIRSETDSLGFFQFLIPESFSKNEIVLVVNSEYGFEGKTKRTILKNELPVTNLIIEKRDVLIGEVIYYKPKKWWQFWKRR
jgi:hypothetical protein